MKLFLIILIICISLTSSSLEKEIQNSDSKFKIISCNNRGIYNDTLNECRCLEGFTTFPKDSRIQCNYEYRSKSVAKFISIFGGIVGADMFYLGHTMKGVFKCFVPLGLFFLILTLQNNKTIQNMNFSYYFILAPISLSLILWIMDFMMISFGILTDANGFKLY